MLLYYERINDDDDDDDDDDVSKGSATPPSQGVEATASPKCRTSYMNAHSTRNVNQVLHNGDQTRCRESFTRPTTNGDARSVCDS